MVQLTRLLSLQSQAKQVTRNIMNAIQKDEMSSEGNKLQPSIRFSKNPGYINFHKTSKLRNIVAESQKPFSCKNKLINQRRVCCEQGVL